MDFYGFEFYVISTLPNIIIFDSLSVDAVSIFPIFFVHSAKLSLGDTSNFVNVCL